MRGKGADFIKVLEIINAIDSVDYTKFFVIYGVTKLYLILKTLNRITQEQRLDDISVENMLICY